MSHEYVIDTYTWIEYFRASKAGEVARQCIESEESATPTIVVSEISRKLLSEINLGNETQEGRSNRLEFIRASTIIVDSDFEIAAKVGEIDLYMRKKRRGWGLTDSIVLCTARVTHGKGCHR